MEIKTPHINNIISIEIAGSSKELALQSMLLVPAEGEFLRRSYLPKSGKTNQ